MNIHSLINELEKLAERSVHLPGGRVLMDENSLRQIIDELRLATPDEGRMSQRVTQERDRILAEARAQARRIAEDAQAQINSRLDDQTTVQLARERARQVVMEAEQQAGRIRADANTYVASQLGSLENRLQRLLHEVQAGQRYLAQPLGAGSPANTDELDRQS